MAGGLLQLAYLGEVAVVFNLAYSELGDRRYVERAESAVSLLRNKLGQKPPISLNNVDLYAHLNGLTHNASTKRRSAWACCDGDGFLLGIWNGFLADKVYSFFMSRDDKTWASIFCGVSVLLLVLFTLFDHYSTEQISAHYWCSALTIMLVCLFYPVLTVFFGRSMMVRLNRVAEHLVTAFKNIAEPSVTASIEQEIQVATKGGG